ncbi:hypothetical protein HGG71_05640 [Rhodobacteraceae bacterium R_SAG2]|nr:hypothetical protein [Rhodobacteraceae bacterium R_SAG2]
MILPRPPGTYNPRIEAERNRTLQTEMQKVRRTDRDVEIGSERLVLKSPDGTRWSVTVDNAGTLSATAL